MADNKYTQAIEKAKLDLEHIEKNVRDIGVAVNQLNTTTIQKLNQTFAKTPQEMTNRLKELESTVANLTEQLKKQSKETDRLNQKRKVANSLTGQERENNRILNRNAREQAILQSKLVGEYKKLIVARDQAKRKLRDLIASEQASNKEIKRAQKEFDKYTAKINKANQATSNFSKTSLGGMVKGFNNLMGAFGVVGGIYLFADIAKQGFKLARELDSINFAMRTVIKSESELVRAQGFLLDITERYGAALVTTTARYNKFLAAAQQSGVAIGDTEKIFGTMTKAAGALGLQSHELEGVFLALEQMLSKGKVTTEELRRQLGERLPGAFGIMAKAVGVSVGELDNMLKKGEVLASEVLPKFADEVERAYGIENMNKVENLNASVTRLNNAWVQFVQSITKSEGTLSTVFIKIIDYIGETVKALSYFNNRALIDGSETYNRVLKEQVSYYKELGEEAEAYAKIDQRKALTAMNNIEAEIQARKEKVATLKEEDDWVLKHAREVYKEEAAIKDLQVSLKRETAIRNAAARVLTNHTGYIAEETERQKELEEQLKGTNDEAEKQKIILEGSVDAMQAQINFLKDLRDRTAVTKDEYSELTEEIEALEATLKRFQEGTEGIEVLIGGKSNMGDLDRTDMLDEAAKTMQMEIDLENQKIEAIKALREGGLEHYEHLNDKQIEAVENAVAIQKELQEGLFDSFEQLGEGYLDGRVEKVEEEIELNRDKYAQILNNQELSEEQRSDIEAERDAKERELEKKKRKREKEAFLFKQGMALAEIGINLAKTLAAIDLAAMNIAATIPAPLGLAMSAAFKATNTPLAIQNSAMQAGAILAQTIPKFEQGTDNAPEGLAIIDEKRPEVHMDKHGNIKSFGSTGGAHLTYTEKGDKIIPSHDKFFDMMGYDEMQQAIFKMNMQSNGEQLSKHKVDNIMNTEMKGMRSDLNRLGKEMKKIASRPIHNNVNVTVKEDSAY